ncbi:hypothetical protein L1D59_11980 [Pseudoalteromonas piscicida]|uniref:hypothetical protein n=1 Tax=Pseudoalteromonas piscicida TaxID=43662 RepID=UPI001EFDDCE1|nr:hypothetical protein [Pseudoalteromonas piscicida]MCG9769317.1 hypothetical protein [Pseudoalteromonas piscicida]
MLVALVYAFGLPYLNVLSHKILKQAEEWRHDEVVGIDIIKAKKKAELNEELYKGDPANDYLGDKLKAELKQKNAIADKARADADKAAAESKEAIAKQEKAESEAQQEKMKASEAQRKEDREQRSHEIAKAKHHQEIVNSRFPTLYLFLDTLSKSLMEDDLHVSIGLMSEAVATCFGYDDVDSMLTDNAFTISQLEELTCVVYDDSQLLNDLKKVIQKHKEVIDEGALFDHLVGMFELVDKFRFISSDLMEDVAKEFIDDTSNVFNLVNHEAVSGPIAETNAHSFDVEHTEFIDIDKTAEGYFLAEASANIQGEMDDDRAYSGHEISANFQFVYKPVIGRNGYGVPEIEEVSASLNREY